VVGEFPVQAQRSGENIATNDGNAADVSAAGPVAELTAEWALWGKHSVDNVHAVLACSNGTFTAADFAALIGRYEPGTAEHLPQYTVLWAPSREGAPRFVGIAIREHAPYARWHGLTRYDGSGREMVFTRLFCVPYPSLAEHRVTLPRLLTAAERAEPPTLDSTALLPLLVSLESPRQLASPAPELARQVAALLLTTRPVCILGGEDVPALDRLGFIDEVLSLLPYGLRASLSASTWASPIAQDLKLRLFFASANPDDGSTHHLWWEKPDPVELPPSSDPTVQYYLEWLRNTGERAKSLFRDHTAPLDFGRMSSSRLLDILPPDLTVVDILEDLAVSLEDHNAAATADEVQRLERWLATSANSSGRAYYLHQITRHHLLGELWGLPPETRTRLYRALLQLAFETPFGYEGYCLVEDCVGRSPHATLRAEMLRLTSWSHVTRVLIRAAPHRDEEEVLAALETDRVPPVELVAELQQCATALRVPHRAVVYDLAIRYLQASVRNAGQELTRRGYLADLLEEVFPGDLQAQQTRLDGTLRFVCDGPFSGGWIRDLFKDSNVQPTAAFEAAAAQLTADSPRLTELVHQQAAEARDRLEKRDGKRRAQEQ